MLRRWPKDNDLVHESVFCRINIKKLEQNSELRELDDTYNPENLKESEYYNTDEKYFSTVKYNCVN